MSKHQDILRSKTLEFLNQSGLDLIEFKVTLYQNKKTVECLIDYPQGGVTVTECSKLNKRIVAFLDETNLFGTNFVVEVNSPGLDRTLKNYKDFLRNKGKEICLWLNESIDGKDYVEGLLIDITESELVVNSDNQSLKIGIDLVKTGKLKINWKK